MQGPCCGEFMVTREAVQRRSKSEYEALLRALVGLKVSRDGKSGEGFHAAYVLEQAWCVRDSRLVALCTLLLPICPVAGVATGWPVAA